MPIFAFQCRRCGEVFDALLSSSGADAPACSACGSTEVERLLSAPSIGGQTKAALQRGRAAAAKEGHFSNYSKSELKGKV